MTPETNVTQNAVMLLVYKTAVGTSRSVSTSHIEIDADKDRIGVSKTLLKSPEMQAIRSRDNQGRSWIISRCIENDYLKGGIYLCGLKAVSDVEAYMAIWQSERAALVNKLADTYGALVAIDQRDLKAEFNIRDYPGCRIVNDKLQVSKDALRAEFSLDWEFKAFVTPESLKNVSAEFYEDAKKKEMAKVASMSTEVVYTLREEAKKFFSHFVDKLTPGTDGKQKVLHTSSVEKMREFCELFDAKNIGSDRQLETLVNKAKEAMKGITKDALKAQEPLRDAVRKQFEDLNKKVDGLLVDKPTRMFSFDDAA
jgi:hypothetical protein